MVTRTTRHAGRSSPSITRRVNDMIKLKNLERSYPLAKEKFFYVLRDINLEVEEGDFVSVMGPSGAGKSTLLHILGMHDHGWRGEYFLAETPVHHLKPKERAAVRHEPI